MSSRRRGAGGHWVERQRKDVYVRQAKLAGYRSRAAFKLAQLDRRDHLFKPGYWVVDLGAAPGGWSQYAAQRVGASGRVLAVDIAPIERLKDVTIIKADVCRAECFEAVRCHLGNRPADLVISDMAPNISGVVSRDQALTMRLAETALRFACSLLGPRGALVVKVFEGEDTAAFRAQVEQRFEWHAIRKPAASRNDSAEIYLLARALRPVS